MDRWTGLLLWDMCLGFQTKTHHFKSLYLACCWTASLGGFSLFWDPMTPICAESEGQPCNSKCRLQGFLKLCQSFFLDMTEINSLSQNQTPPLIICTRCQFCLMLPKWKSDTFWAPTSLMGSSYKSSVHRKSILSSILSTLAVLSTDWSYKNVQSRLFALTEALL